MTVENSDTEWTPEKGLSILAWS